MATQEGPRDQGPGARDQDQGQGEGVLAVEPQGTPSDTFCYQMGRYPATWDFQTRIRHRILAWISPWESQGLNPNFFAVYFGPKNA